MFLNESLLRRKLQVKTNKKYVIIAEIFLVYHSFFFFLFAKQGYMRIFYPFSRSNINPSLPRYLEGCAMYILSIIFFLHTRMSILIYYPNVENVNKLYFSVLNILFSTSSFSRYVYNLL